jgi:hypothetical protein
MGYCIGFDIAERKLPSGCSLCNKPVVKGDKILRVDFRAWKNNASIYIHTEHILFHDPKGCKERFKILTDNQMAKCPLCQGLNKLKEKAVAK